MASVGELIASATDRLRTLSTTAKLDAELLAAHTLQVSREWVIAHHDEQLDSNQEQSYLDLVERREKGEPLAYLVGTRGFWNREFVVTEDTLIPRPETELLIETLLERFDESKRSLVDLGTGTGIIAISIAEERPDWEVTATDLSDEALAVAQENSTGLTNIRFQSGSWCEPLTERFDIIVSNPPYIRKDDPHLNDLTFEPALALIAGDDGLSAYKELIPQAYKHLNPSGTLLLEHGYDQQDEITALLAENQFTDIETLRDLSGNPRATLARRES